MLRADGWGLSLCHSVPHTVLSGDQWKFIAQRPLVHLLIYGCVKANLMKIDDKGLFINYGLGGRQMRGGNQNLKFGS